MIKNAAKPIKQIDEPASDNGQMIDHWGDDGGEFISTSEDYETISAALIEFIPTSEDYETISVALIEFIPTSEDYETIPVALIEFIPTSEDYETISAALIEFIPTSEDYETIPVALIASKIVANQKWIPYTTEEIRSLLSTACCISIYFTVQELKLIATISNKHHAFWYLSINSVNHMEVAII